MVSSQRREGREADASAWATRPTLEAGLDTVRTLTRDWIARWRSPPARRWRRRIKRSRLSELPAREPAAFARLLASLSRCGTRIAAHSNVSPALVADFVRMALAPSSP